MISVDATPLVVISNIGGQLFVYVDSVYGSHH